MCLWQLSIIFVFTFIDGSKKSNGFSFALIVEPFIQNALILPHLGYVTAENYSIFYTQMIENLEACVDGKPIRLIEN